MFVTIVFEADFVLVVEGPFGTVEAAGQNGQDWCPGAKPERRYEVWPVVMPKERPSGKT